MKIGDLVRKVKGNLDNGCIGVVLHIETTAVGNTVDEVSTNGLVERWFANYCLLYTSPSPRD